jgi:exodeoxyribonuclease V beta subunit
MQKFYTLHQKWQNKGIIAAINHLMLSKNTRQQILSLSMGERKLTNYMQLIELLHQYERENSVQMTGLLLWLRKMIQNNDIDKDEHLLRLESDSQAVKIITIHKSKGLEFPVVFCPFLHAGSRITPGKDEQIFYHSDDDRLVLDLGSKELKTKKIVAEKEILGENLRLMYVALTRAKHRCYMTWGKIKDADTSAPAYLFHLPHTDDSVSILEQLEECFKKLNFEDIKKYLTELAHTSQGCVTISSLDKDIYSEPALYREFENKAKDLSALDFTRHLDKTWSITSFTSLTTPNYIQKTKFDDDISHSESFSPGFLSQPATPDEKNIFTLEPGFKTGNLLHELLERLDFKHPQNIKNLIPGQLERFGFDREWENVIQDLMQRVATLQLKPGLNLKDIGSNERITEMEFYLL